MVAGVSILIGLACGVAVVAARATAGARTGRWWILLVTAVVTLAVMTAWALRTEQFPATFGPYLLTVMAGSALLFRRARRG